MTSFAIVTAALKILLAFIGALTLGIGGIGSDEHHAGFSAAADAGDRRGKRRWARKRHHILLQFSRGKRWPSLWAGGVAGIGNRVHDLLGRGGRYR